MTKISVSPSEKARVEPGQLLLSAENRKGSLERAAGCMRDETGFRVVTILTLAQVMTYYVVYIFSMAGLSGNINLTASGVQYALFIIFTQIMFFYIDKTARRTLLVWGAVAMGICHFIVGGILSGGEVVPGGVNGNPNVPIQVTGNSANAVIAFCYLLIIIYALTLAPVCWIYAAEVCLLFLGNSRVHEPC